MKTKLNNYLLAILIATIYLINPLHAQEKQRKGKFSHIDLLELRETLLNNLSDDGLIMDGEPFYLSLTKNAITINEVDLDDAMTDRYQSLLAPFKIGTGTNRTVYISPRGTAVGDISSEGFSGIFKGSFDDGELSGVRQQ